MNKEGDGVGQTLLNVLKHPATLGALGGAAIGGGIGYLSPDDPKLRRRGALVGAGTGAVLGGLGGALSTAGLNTDEVQNLTNQSQSVGMVRGYEAGVQAGNNAGMQAGFLQGKADVVSKMPIDPAVKVRLMKAMIEGGI